MPPAYVISWLAFVPKGGLRLSAAAWALIPPIAYAAYTFVHGPWTGFYPYPFVDVPKIGVWHTARNVLEFVVFFYVMGIFFVALDRLIARFRRSAERLTRGDCENCRSNQHREEGITVLRYDIRFAKLRIGR
jgi:hypothetical protein